jgi:hypothetical protein
LGHVLTASSLLVLILLSFFEFPHNVKGKKRNIKKGKPGMKKKRISEEMVTNIERTVIHFIGNLQMLRD